ncbi:hypothetical protein BT93_L0949 [Corymbia citriodora subsp. variegata]|uniref:Fungal lipase-type domain-containing protein n=1 Tax=Corymbia citriodora subsp. variegata TaxID=360336 RepID=A0A8T0CZ35_CORYI|nr:hypothetical protein BT93_L0949 [Corymbia citriodora subsp. variegata]
MTIQTGILDAIIRTKDLYGVVNVMVTEHSMGRAMASFCGLDLVVLTFEQPRIGNVVFASYCSDHVPKTLRITTGHDVLPHLPLYYFWFPQKTYHQFPREVWLYNIGFGRLVYQVEIVCDTLGQDASCNWPLVKALWTI